MFKKNVSIIHFNPIIRSYSVGAASAHFQVLSNESRQYINRAYLSSGTALANWAMHTEPDHLSMAYGLAHDFGHVNCTFMELIDFLKTVPAEKLSDVGFSTSVWFPILNVKLAPIIESITLS